ncbi:hypothetical protein MTO96_048981 [Rhipicephalus appendiculatus]
MRAECAVHRIYRSYRSGDVPFPHPFRGLQRFVVRGSIQGKPFTCHLLLNDKGLREQNDARLSESASFDNFIAEMAIYVRRNGSLMSTHNAVSPKGRRFYEHPPAEDEMACKLSCNYHSVVFLFPVIIDR